MLKHIVTLLLITILASCSNSVDTVTETTIQPKLGSTFMYDEYNTDTTKSERIPGTTDTLVSVFVLTGQTFKGKTNVSTVISSTKIGSKIYFDTIYVNYETNNDISLIEPSGIGSLKWVTIPVASKLTNADVLFDTTGVNPFSGESTHSTISYQSSYVGNESLTVKGKAVNVVKIKQLLTFKDVTAKKTEINEFTNYMYFAPTLGFRLKMETLVRTNSNGEKEEGNVSSVIDYQLK